MLGIHDKYIYILYQTICHVEREEGREIILPRDVPHRWAYGQGSEGTTPCEVTPFEQGRCVIDLPYIVQQASGDRVYFVAGLNKIEAEQLARLNGVWLLANDDPFAV